MLVSVGWAVSTPEPDSVAWWDVKPDRQCEGLVEHIKNWTSRPMC